MAIVTATAQVLVARFNRRQSDAQAEVHNANASKIQVETANDLVEMIKVDHDRMSERLAHCEAMCERQGRWIRMLTKFIRDLGLEPPTLEP